MICRTSLDYELPAGSCSGAQVCSSISAQCHGTRRREGHHASVEETQVCHDMQSRFVYVCMCLHTGMDQAAKSIVFSQAGMTVLYCPFLHESGSSR